MKQPGIAMEGRTGKIDNMSDRCGEDRDRTIDGRSPVRHKDRTEVFRNEE
jgi:hypothetical protein